jgi:hypothetical protein
MWKGALVTAVLLLGIVACAGSSSAPASSSVEFVDVPCSQDSTDLGAKSVDPPEEEAAPPPSPPPLMNNAQSFSSIGASFGFFEERCGEACQLDAVLLHLGLIGDGLKLSIHVIANAGERSREVRLPSKDMGDRGRADLLSWLREFASLNSLSSSRFAPMRGRLGADGWWLVVLE